MKTVIVPSNGNASLVDNYGVVGEMFPGEMIHYIFLDIRAVPDSYTDLITICRDGRNRGNFSEAYCAAALNLASCGHNCTASVDHIYGDSAPVFRNYLEYREADLVLFDQAQLSDHPQFQERDIFRMVIRSGAEILYIPGTAAGREKTTLGNKSISVQTRSRMRNAVLIPSKSATGKYGPAAPTADAPASIMVRYTSVDEMLNNLQNEVPSQNILIQPVSRLSRYFMKQSTLERMLLDSKREVLWLKK